MISHFVHAARAILGERDNQEDAFGFTVVDSGEDGSAGGPMLVAVVADGMGGHAAGEEASRAAVDAFTGAFEAPAGRSGLSSVEHRLSALAAANEAIAQRISANPALDGMGCTLVAACLHADGLHWLSVGDSALFHFRDGLLVRLNEDHSMAPVLEDLAERGLMDRVEAMTSPRRHHLRSALTGRPIELVDAPENGLALEPGDWVLIASDGIDVLPTGVVESIVSENANGTSDQMVSALLDAVVACNDPYQDNTSIFAIQACELSDGENKPPTRPLTERAML